MVSIVIVHAFLILIYLAANSCKEIDFVYSPLHLKKYDITDQQGASTKIKVAEKANLVFVSAGGQGVIVLDGQTNEIIFEMKTDEFLFTIEATSDGEFVMISYSQQFSVFQFQNRTSLNLLSQAEFPTSIIDMFINNKENIVFAVGLKGHLIAYDISNKNSVKQIGYFSSQSNIIHQVYISKDDQWIFLGNDVLGLAVLKLISNPSDNQIQFLLAGQGIMQWKTWAAVITDDQKYVYGLDNWFGIYICEFSQITSASQDQYPVNINFISYWPFQNSYLSYSLKLTKDNKYLIVGFRSVGVFIFDIEDRLNPSFFQSIPVLGQALSINLSPDEQYLYYANALSIYVLERRPANLNNHYPNLFNQQQATLQNPTEIIYRWRCFNKNINEIDYYFGSFDVDGFYIYNASDPYNLVKVYSQKFSLLTLVDSMILTQDKKYLYVPIQDNDISFIVYDVSDIKSPKEVFKLDINNNNHIENIMISKDQNYIVCSNDIGILLLDCSQPPTLVLLAAWNVLPFMTGENAGVMITNDNHYILGTVRNYGVYILDASVKTNLIYKTSLQTLGAEMIISSIYSNDYAFLLDGFKGVAILDLTVLPQISILSRIPLLGWVNFLVSMNQDNYLLIVVMEEEMLTLVDISNKKVPKVLSKYQYQTQSAHSVCLSSNQQYSFINNQFGTVVLPLQSQATIHTEIQKISVDINGGETLESVSKDEILKVGQYIQLQFVFLYPVNGIKIVSANYYSQFQNNPLPFWMNYNKDNGILLIQVDKSGLDSKNINNPNLNTILLKVLTPLSPQSFQFNQHDVVTTPSQAQQIYSTLKHMNLIDSMGYVTELFDSQNSLFFEIDGMNCTNRLYQKTQLTIQQSININPVIFYIQPSLSINITNLDNVIQTMSKMIQLFLTVDIGKGKFVLQDFNGIIASTNDQQNQIKLEGSLINLNSILQKKLIFANFTDMQRINVTITMIDDVNYDVINVSLISQCAFIKQKDQITKNNQNSLQSQFNKQQPLGEIDILTFFSISFAKNSFIVHDVQTITYQVFLLFGQQYKQLTTDDWIQFQEISGQITISGIPPASAFKQTFYIKIVASDGYTQDSDVFYIIASGLPFIIVFNILIKVLGPIFALFGLYKYKSYVLNLMFTKIITYSQETAIVGKFYYKKIALTGDQMEKCQLLFGQFLEKFQHDQVQLNGVEQFYNHELEKEVNEPQKEQNLSSLLENQKDNFNPLRKLKVISDLPSRNDEFLKKSITIIQMSKKHTQKTPFEQKYLKKDGSVNIKKIICDIKLQNLSFNLRGKKFYASSLISDFKNPDSLIFNGIKALAARYFLKQDQRSYQIYSYIKYYAQKYHNYTKNDWYKSIFTIIPSDDKDCYDLPVPFSHYKLNEQQINLILIDLQVHNQIGQSFESLKNLDINHHLIKEVLLADAKGLIEDTPSIFFPSQGESIHLFQYEIESVEAFKKVENTWFLRIRKALNLEYVSYGISKSQNLPNWLQLEYKKGSLILQGIPQSQDEESILIRITDQDQQVVQQFMLNIVYEYSEQEDEINFPNKMCDSIVTEEFLQQSRLQSNYQKKSEVSYINSPNAKNSKFDNSNLLFNRIILSEDQMSNYKRARASTVKRVEHTQDKYENTLKTNINDQSTISEQVQFNLKVLNKEDSLKDFKNQNSLNSSIQQNQIAIIQQSNFFDHLQSSQQSLFQDQNLTLTALNSKRDSYQTNQIQIPLEKEEENELNTNSQFSKNKRKSDVQKSLFQSSSRQNSTKSLTQIIHISQKDIEQENQEGSKQDDSIQEEQKVQSLNNINQTPKLTHLNHKYFIEKEISE